MCQKQGMAVAECVPAHVAKNQGTLNVSSLPSSYRLAWRLQKICSHAGFVRCCCFFPDGQEMTGASDDHTINLWQVSDGDVLRTLSKHAGFVCCCHSADGEPSCPNLSVLNTCARAFPSNTDTAVPVPAIKEERQRQQK